MQAVCTTLCRVSAQCYAGHLHRLMQDACTGNLPFEFVQLVHLYAADIAIDVNHDGNGHGRFGCRDGNGEQGEEARKYYRENQIPVFAYSSLARGFLSGRYRTDGRKRMEECIMQAAIQEYNSPENIEKLRKAEILAQKKGCGVSEIALAWLLHQNCLLYTSPSPRDS